MFQRLWQMDAGSFPNSLMLWYNGVHCVPSVMAFLAALAGTDGILQKRVVLCSVW